jgi:hypothetical protein
MIEPVGVFGRFAGEVRVSTANLTCIFFLTGIVAPLVLEA